MQLNKIKYLSFFVLLIFSACSQQNEENRIEEIRAIEKQIFEEENYKVSDEKLDLLIEKYADFVNDFPQHTKAPEYLFRRADLYRAKGDPGMTARLLERLYHDYPDFESRPQVLFLIGFTYENEINEINEATYWYNRFLEEYPSHQLAEDVKYSLRHVGRPVEDLIREWETREQETN